MEVVSPNCSVLSDRSLHAAHAHPASFFRSLFFLSSPSYLLFFASSCLCFSRRQNERVIAIYRNNTGEKKRDEGVRQTIALRDNARRRCFADAFKIIGGFSIGEFLLLLSLFFFFFFFEKREGQR